MQDLANQCAALRQQLETLMRIVDCYMETAEKIRQRYTTTTCSCSADLGFRQVVDRITHLAETLPRE